MDIDILVEELIGDEGEKLKPYRCTAGKLTIGIGRNLDDKGITEEEARYLCVNDIVESWLDLEKIFDDWDKIDTVRQHTFVSMRFTLGPSGFRGFKNMIHAVNNWEWESASDEIVDSEWYRNEFTHGRAKKAVERIKNG